MNFLKVFVISIPIFFLVDLLWLGVLAKDIYQKYLGQFLRESPIWPAAIIFYLFFVVGLVVFVISPALEKNSWTHALMFGSFYGFITYMTYELTNYALIKGWPWQIVIIDIIWGIVLSATVAVASFLVAKWLF
jgi:uncharacterized membrane protein